MLLMFLKCRVVVFVEGIAVAIFERQHAKTACYIDEHLGRKWNVVDREFSLLHAER